MNLKQVLKDLKGEPLKQDGEEATLGRIISSILASAKTKDPMRAYVLAQSIYQDKGDLELNRADLDFIKNAVSENQTFVPLVTGQILSMLEDPKEARKK